jgi:hypothetical protein
MRATDPWYWCYHNGIQLAAGAFAHERHEYLAEVMRDQHPNQVDVKGSQMGFTEAAALKTIHSMIHDRLPQGTLYLFPTADDVSDFAKARFNSLIDKNPGHIGAYIKSTDATNIKRIGKAMLYLRGARASQKIEGLAKTSSKLKSIPVDRIVYDEFDEMDQAMIPLARERFAHSNVKEEHKLSTPTVPGYGIDAAYKASDQNVWMIRCDRCRHDTVMELEFPRCLSRRRDGTVFRACVHCGREIHPADGRWVAQAPQVKDCRGRLMSQLCSGYVDLTALLNEFERLNELQPAERQVFYNSKLARAYVDAANRLTIQDVYRCIGQDAMDTRHNGPCAMGVDVGNTLHVVVGYRPSAGLTKIAFAGRVQDWTDVHDIAARFNVQSAVIDQRPELHKAREFQKAEPYEIFLAFYVERQRGDARWDLEEGLVTINRTECLDRVHTAVMAPGRFEIPRLNSELEQYATEVCNVVKVLVEKPDGGRVSEYKDIGPDHYRHATAYMLLAASRIGISFSTGRSWWDNQRPAGMAESYDPLGRVPYAQVPASPDRGGQAADFNPFGG